MFSSGSIRLFEVKGTVVRIHLTFFLLLIWIGVIHWMRGGLAEAIYGVVFIAILFACVVLHEFGHIFAARRYGIRTPDVTLLPIGGVASLERMPEKPSQEIFVALAGPAVNLVIAAVLFLLVGSQVEFSELTMAERAPSSLIAQVAVANLVLLVFNLIPAFPMDGGRVLRAVLAIGLGYRQATRVAAIIGQVLAIGFAVLGFMGNPFLILIALFIFIAAAGEAGYVETRSLTQGYHASDAMISKFESLATNADADTAASLLLETTQQEFPIVDGANQLRGVLTRENLIVGIKKSGGATPVLDIMTGDIPTVDRDSSLEKAFEILQKRKSPIIGVVDHDHKFLGYINSENLAELMMLRASRSENN